MTRQSTQHLLTFGRLSGACMLPSMDPEAHTLIERTVARRIRRGDIAVVVARNGRTLFHRIVRIRSQGRMRLFTTKPDLRWTCDAPVQDSALIGRIVAIRGRTGWSLATHRTQRLFAGLALLHYILQQALESLSTRRTLMALNGISGAGVGLFRKGLRRVSQNALTLMGQDGASGMPDRS